MVRIGLDNVTYTGAQILGAISSWKSEAFYLDVVYPPALHSFFSPFCPSKIVPVPSLEEVNKAQADLKEKPNAHGVMFSNYGYVSREHLPHLWRRCQLFDLADHMRLLVQWLQENQAALCNDFLDDLLGSEARHWKISSLGLREVMCLKEEDYLSAQVIETLLEAIQECYKDKVLCISFHFLETWDPDQRREKSNYWESIMTRRLRSYGRRTTKAFAVVRILQNHWGLLCVDLIRGEFSFGDSMDQGIVLLTDDVMSTIRKVECWLRQAGLMDSPWPLNIARLDVPQQPHDSGSGGVIVLNTIECSVNPSIEPWTHPRTAYHRIRYLQAASGYRNLSQLNEDLELHRERLLSSLLSGNDLRPQGQGNFQSEPSGDDGREPQRDHLLSSVLTEKAPESQEQGSFRSELNGDDGREPQRDHFQPSALTEKDPEFQDQGSFQSELSGDGREPQQGDIYQSREAAIEQLRRWAQRSGFRLLIGHTKTGKEMKVRLDCSGLKRQRKEPYSSGQHDPKSKRRTDCGFHINIRSTQKIPDWYITSIVGPHNHDLDRGNAITRKKPNNEGGDQLAMCDNLWVIPMFVI
ncbi:hypothetical protein BGX34_003120 [Mortierella sp. NVP85]|nr:hypothetical protein BGX34_003120 [Mortierella sp. NVP85]